MGRIAPRSYPEPRERARRESAALSQSKNSVPRKRLGRTRGVDPDHGRALVCTPARLRVMRCARASAPQDGRMPRRGLGDRMSW